MHRARRMVRGEVQRLEVVPVVLDLGTFGHRIAELRENRLDALARAGERMDGAALAIASRLGDIDAFGRQALFQYRALKGFLACSDRASDLLLRDIDPGATRLALVRRELAERLQFRGDRAVLAEQRDTLRLQCIQRCRRGDRGQRFLGALRQGVHHGPMQKKSGKKARPSPRLLAS